MGLIHVRQNDSEILYWMWPTVADEYVEKSVWDNMKTAGTVILHVPSYSNAICMGAASQPHQHTLCANGNLTFSAISEDFGIEVHSPKYARRELGRDTARAKESLHGQHATIQQRYGVDTGNTSSFQVYVPRRKLNSFARL